MTRFNIHVCFAMGAMLMASTGTAAEADLSRLLPAELEGYRPRGPDGLYDADTLFQLINGGAEVYRALNLQRALSRRYGSEGQPDVIADLFDMGSAPDAFGAYRNDMREGPSAGVGQESEYQGSSLYFWKDRYFVSVVAIRDTQVSRNAVLALGKAIAARIPGEGRPPGLVDWLPAAGQDRGQVHYFHSWESLNRRVVLADENLLGLGRDTEGMLARYQPAAALVVVRFPNPDRARRAHERFVERFSPPAEREDGWLAARQDGEVWIAVIDAKTKPGALALLGQVKRPGKE